ncbi:LacI family DNA-binding transcriptional regulator [Enterococcus nangangensis]|uniref:LacI family DNA-binding transcriptional regulator n=1 Tax=Enterococcus nangangensis TaxID=2559926 RepID=UPI0010F567FA|nr:LacI family DNA-binding transcriptional regulator [Enterococcus nangangensis]
MVTIKDIAKVAGVSHTTVSRALNDSPLIKTATKDKIKTIAAEMNYVPNFSARSLVQQKSYRIGLFFSSIQEGTSASFLVDAIRGINGTLSSRYSLAVNGIDTLANYDNINPQVYDGIIIMSQSDDDDYFIQVVREAGIPFVVLNRQLDDENILNVTSNDSLGVAEGIRYGISLGHRKIALIGGKAGFRSSIERRLGFIEGVTTSGLPLPTDYLVEGDYSIESGRECCEKLLALTNPPTLIFCANDDMAIGALKACAAAQLKVPQDVAIMGFDNILFSQYTSPALTTVSKPIYEISQTGTAMLLDAIAGEDIQPKQKLLQTTLVKRESV